VDSSAFDGQTLNPLAGVERRVARYISVGGMLGGEERLRSVVRPGGGGGGAAQSQGLNFMDTSAYATTPAGQGGGPTYYSAGAAAPGGYGGGMAQMGGPDVFPNPGSFVLVCRTSLLLSSFKI